MVLDKLDRLSWVTESALGGHLLNTLVLSIATFLREVNIFVNDKRVEPTDPLFTTPGCRFYDLDEDRAEPLEPTSFEVKDPETGKSRDC